MHYDLDPISAPTQKLKMIKVGIFGLIIAAFLVACASPAPTPPSALESQVEFSSSQSTEQFTIKCRPRTKAIGKTGSWVDTCNQLGKLAIERAVAKNLIAPVQGEAFGMASKFMAQAPDNVAISKKTMSRDFPLIKATKF